MGAQTIRDVVVRIKLQTVAGKTSDAGVRQAQRDFDRVIQRQGQSLRSQQQTLQQSAQAQQQSVQQTSKSAAVLSNRSLEIGQSLQDIGDGFFTTARGAAFLFSSTEDGFGQMIKTVADVQGAFDSYRGTLQITKGTLGALGVDAGPAGVAGVGLASLAGAVSIGISLWDRYNPAARKAREEERKLAEQRERSAQVAKRFAAEQERLNRALSRQDQIKSINQQRGAFQELRDEIKGVNVEHGRLLRNHKQAAKIVSFDSIQQGLGLPKNLLNDLKAFPRFDPTGQFRGIRFRDNPLKALETFAKDGEVRVPGKPGTNQENIVKLAPGRQLSAAKLAVSIRKQQLELLQQEAQINQRTIQQNNAKLQAEKDRLKTLQETLKTQQESVRSQQASAGRLTPGQQTRLRQLIQGQKSGNLNRGQLLELEQLGGGINAVRQSVDSEFARRGQGIANFAAQQLGGAPLTGQGSAIQGIQQRIKQQQEAVTKVAKDIGEDNQLLRSSIESIGNTFERTAKRLNELQQKVDQLERTSEQRALAQ